ncbi:MAG: DUF4837 family protein [Rubricoccaceae bacterium]|nr:DUF4837 family protein [Rubricoccaceae bacterium]
MTKWLSPALLAIFALLACNEIAAPRPNGVGAPGEIVVVADTNTWKGPVGDALRSVLGRSVAPPLGGLSDFSLVRRDLTNENFNLLRNLRHIVFAAALDDTSNVARFLEARLDSTGTRLVRSGEGTVVLTRPDLWANNQMVVLATAGTDSLLAAAIRANADTLRKAYTELSLEATQRDMFSRGRQQEIEEELLERHGFAVTVQHDYFISQDTTLTVDNREGHFVRLRRVLSDTWRDYFVYYEEIDPTFPIDSTRMERVTDAALEQFVRGEYDSSFVEIDRIRPVSSEPVVINGRDAVQYRGLWRMTEEFMGGPFVRYVFVDESQQRMYIFFGMIFAPQHRFRGQKREFLRQLEVTARTFRTL